jgi:hypothetical protein
LAQLLVGFERLKKQAQLIGEDAKRNDNPSIRESFLQTERAYRELAAKYEPLAREPEPVALELPVLRMPS